MHPDVLSLRQAADLLGVHPVTVRKRAKTGDLPGAQIGTSWRFWRPALLAELTSGTMPTKPDATREFVSTHELAALLGLSEVTVRSLLRDGAIPAGKVGLRWRVHWPTVRALIGGSLEG